MQFLGCTFVYNIEELIPYVMPYVDRYGLDRLIVYNNGSTDNTVELLSKYPYVEIRDCTLDDYTKWMEVYSVKMFDFYDEAKKISTSNDELVWVTFFDFDEVILFTKDVPLKKYLEVRHDCQYMNHLEKEMINILPPKGEDCINIKEGQLIHTVEGVRGEWACCEFHKPILFAINDFSYIRTIQGNHGVGYKLEEGADRYFNNLADEGYFHVFHLKYINKRWLIESTAKRDDENRGYKGESSYLEKAYYENHISVSFPLENYFLLDGLNHKKEWFEGFFEDFCE